MERGGQPPQVSVRSRPKGFPRSGPESGATRVVRNFVPIAAPTPGIRTSSFANRRRVKRCCRFLKRVGGYGPGPSRPTVLRTPTEAARAFVEARGPSAHFGTKFRVAPLLRTSGCLASSRSTSGCRREGGQPRCWPTEERGDFVHMCFSRWACPPQSRFPKHGVFHPCCERKRQHSGGWMGGGARLVTHRSTHIVGEHRPDLTDLAPTLATPGRSWRISGQFCCSPTIW